MKVLFDTCVIVDILGRSRFFVDSFTAYDVALFKQMDTVMSVSSSTDIVYLMKSRGFMTRAEARNVANVISEQFDVIDNTPVDLHFAAESEMSDFEDALIAYSAFRCGVDFIVTRNKKDFAKSPVPALTPSEFVDLYKPSCLHYAETEF